jgi:hypothetical protein
VESTGDRGVGKQLEMALGRESQGLSPEQSAIRQVLDERRAQEAAGLRDIQQRINHLKARGTNV